MTQTMRGRQTPTIPRSMPMGALATVSSGGNEGLAPLRLFVFLPSGPCICVHVLSTFHLPQLLTHLKFPSRLTHMQILRAQEGEPSKFWISILPCAFRTMILRLGLGSVCVCVCVCVLSLQPRNQGLVPLKHLVPWRPYGDVSSFIPPPRAPTL